jgi:tRNA-dependent cyclodipeptide synthase
MTEAREIAVEHDNPGSHIAQSYSIDRNDVLHSKYACANQRVVYLCSLLQQKTKKKYKAYYRWTSAQDKLEFMQSHTLVLISVGQQYHESEQLDAELCLINKSFKQCTILVGDTLQRHSLQILYPGIKEQEAYEISRLRGIEWRQRNQKYIDALTIPHSVITWDWYLKHKDFPKYLDLVYKLYDNDSEYRETVYRLAENFINRDEARWHDRKAAFELSLKYLQEESAATCVWAMDGFRFNVYPTGDNEAMSVAYRKLVACERSQYRSLSLNIKKTGSL